MLLKFFTVFYVLFGSSCGSQHKELCYGDSVDLELYSLNKKLYFYPRGGRDRKVLIDNQEVKDPRLKVSNNSVKLTQLTEKDNGRFSMPKYYGKVLTILSLTTVDCSTNISLFYGEELVHDVPSNAELLEFTPFHSLDQPQLLWERANPHNNHGGRGKVSEDVFRISRVTQEDNGNYNFRQEDKSMVSMLRLTVKENITYYDFEEHKDIFLPFPWASGDWTVTFKPHLEEEDITIIKAGSVVRNSNPFYHKIIIKDYGIGISHAEYSDAGIFEFRDPAGNLALVSQVNITESHHSTSNLDISVFNASVVVPVALALLGVLCCYCYCCKKCCCKKAESHFLVPQTITEHKVYERGLNEPDGSGFSAPPYSAAFPPPAGSAGIPHDASAASFGLVVYQTKHEETNISQPGASTHEVKNVSQPEVTPGASDKSAPSSSFGYNPLSSDSQPMFIVKGLSSTFYLPLSTEICFTDGYTSDKMNFL